MRKAAGKPQSNATMRDLKGATPEKLARALLKQPDLGPHPASEAVVHDKVAVKKVAADKARDSVPHLHKRP